MAGGLGAGGLGAGGLGPREASPRRLGAGARLRKAGWRFVLATSGGLRVEGRLPGGPCVIVANHSSHADTPALIAAMPARRRPAVAAAADYWFGRGVRARACRLLCGAFPVRRSGGGSADLAAAAGLLAGGQDVIVYPEGTRCRDGRLGEFRGGAARLAAAAGVPVVPVAITGTRALLPPGGKFRRATVTVRIGHPVTVAAAQPASIAMSRAREQIIALGRPVSATLRSDAHRQRHTHSEAH
jgi:1-acyl-sn-glycerol-3-phosphate acyltransferase